MCSVTLALAGLTTGLSMAGQYQQSRAEAASLEAQAQSAKYQAESQRQLAEYTEKQAEYQRKVQQQQAEAEYQNARIQNRKSEQMAEQYADQQRKLDERRRLIVGQQAAAAGASGIMGGLGSSLDIYNASLDAYGQDSLSLLTNQRNSMYDNYLQEVNYRNAGNANIAQGENAYNQGMYQAGEQRYQASAYDAQAYNLRQQAKAAKSAGNLAMVGTLLSGAASMYGMKGAGGGSGTSSQTWVGNTPRSVYESTGVGIGRYY